jgi:hypothetical protein
LPSQAEQIGVAEHPGGTQHGLGPVVHGFVHQLQNDGQRDHDPAEQRDLGQQPAPWRHVLAPDQQIGALLVFARQQRRAPEHGHHERVSDDVVADDGLDVIDPGGVGRATAPGQQVSDQRGTDHRGGDEQRPVLAQGEPEQAGGTDPVGSPEVGMRESGGHAITRFDGSRYRVTATSAAGAARSPKPTEVLRGRAAARGRGAAVAPVMRPPPPRRPGRIRGRR